MIIIQVNFWCGGADPSVGRLVSEAMAESLKPYQSLVKKGWEVIQANLVRQAAITLQVSCCCYWLIIVVC